jgi:hypothetical protein
MVPTTSIAGRHAADRRRAQHQAPQDEERRQQYLATVELAYRLRLRGLALHADLLGEKAAIAVNCRLDHCREDHQYIYALLDELGWISDRGALIRSNAKYDSLQLVQQTTGAALFLIIKIPTGIVEPLEAA